jgi:hypothetical protein
MVLDHEWFVSITTSLIPYAKYNMKTASGLEVFMGGAH